MRQAPGRTGAARRVLARATAVLLAIGIPVAAGATDDYAVAPGFFLKGLAADSSWESILRQPQIEVAWPYLPSGSRYLPLPLVCLSGERALEMATPVRPIAAGAPAAARYQVAVFRALRQTLNPHRVFLFNKVWEVPACGPDHPPAAGQP